MSVGKIEMPVSWVAPDGKEWNLYSLMIPTIDGVYSTYIYAVSFLHAQLLLEDLKSGGFIDGRITGITKI